ncbi:MAG: hypothetical protein K2Y37_11590 [Pirellulales bacterium]|nr:hypothetical protein [Pirellulales bacterium]
MTIGSFVVPALAGEGFGVYVGNDVVPPVVASKMDMVAISRAIGFGSEVPGQVRGVAAAFGDSDLAHLSGTALPTEAQMANFETGQLTLTVGPPITSGGAVVGSIQLVPVPEPGTRTLTLVAGIMLLGLAPLRSTMRYQRRFASKILATQ